MKLFFMISGIALFLSGCASEPTHVALNPELPLINTQVSGQQSLSLSSSDTRNNNVVARFLKDGKVVRVMNPSEPPTGQLQQVFREGFSRAGYQIDPSSATGVELQLSTLNTDIEEGMLGYEANTKLVIDVIARNEQQVFSKRYRNVGKFKRPLGLDMATLELHLNKLMGELTGEIINDPELNSFLQK
jgi:uncharacterized lipoprotein